MMPAAPGTEGNSSDVLAPAQFSLLESTPFLTLLQPYKISPSLKRIRLALGRTRDGKERSLLKDLDRLIPC